MNRKDAELATSRLLDVMDKLRAECPWDREQTFDSLRNNTIEETYELADAITDKNMEGIKEELGDLFAMLSSTRSWAMSRVRSTIPMWLMPCATS